jgi:zinc/manganese transport system substrate-binding protein
LLTLRRRLGLIIGALLLVITLSGCQSVHKQTANSKLQIVASTPTYGQMATQIAGKYAQVTTIMANPNVDPHDFEPTVQNAKQTSRAQIAIYNGLGYDSWMNRLLVNNQQATKINIGQLMHKQVGDNPHLWYHPQTMPTAAQHLAEVLSRQDPTHRAYYQQRAQKYLQSLQLLQQQIHQIKIHRQQKLVAVSEPVFDYSLQKMGYQIANPHFAQAIEEGADPAPQDINKLQQLIKTRKIAFLVDNQQAANPVVANLVKLAQKYQVPVVKVTETQPANLSYLQWMERQYHKVLTIEVQK